MKNEKEKFKNEVYWVVRQIPKGKVLTYKKVAQLAGKPRAWRVIGNILSKNRNPRIPCHRVIRSNGEIGGYRSGQTRKIELLKKEGIIIKGKKIVL